jgi:hypothetical protein
MRSSSVCHSRAILSSLLLLVFACLGCGRKDAKSYSSQLSASAEPPAETQAVSQSVAVSEFSGEVTSGQRFEKAVAGDLIFRLVPDAGGNSGWEIRLAPGAEPSPASIDCIGAVSVPLHGDGTLSIQSPGLDKDRDQSQWAKREFDFVPNSSNCRRAWDLAIEAHYPSKLTEAQREQADADLGKIPTSRGALEITDFRLSKSVSKDAPAQIEWLKFVVYLALLPSLEAHAPSTQSPAASLPSAAPGAQPAASRITHFIGEVERGQQFEKSLAPNLSFRLEPFSPASFSGWIIQIAPEPHSPDSSIGPLDCIGTVLERSKQSVQLSVVAPKDATEAQADSWRQREFDFIPEASDCTTAWNWRIAAFYPAYYPSSLSDQQREDAKEKLTRLPKGRASFRILDWRSGGPPDDFNPTGVIQWLKFEVSLDTGSDSSHERR